MIYNRDGTVVPMDAVALERQRLWYKGDGDATGKWCHFKKGGVIFDSLTSLAQSDHDLGGFITKSFAGYPVHIQKLHDLEYRNPQTGNIEQGNTAHHRYYRQLLSNLQLSRWNRFPLVGLSDMEKLPSGTSMMVDLRSMEPKGEYWNGDVNQRVIEFHDYYNKDNFPLIKTDFIAGTRLNNPMFQFAFYLESPRHGVGTVKIGCSNWFKNYMTYGNFRASFKLLGNKNPFQIKKFNTWYVIPGFRDVQSKDHFSYFQDRYRVFFSRDIMDESYYGKVYDSFYVFRENTAPTDGEIVLRVLPFTIKPSSDP
jgi:hypothetical protein